MRGPFKLLTGAVLIVCACSDYTGPDSGGGDEVPAATASVNVEDNQFVRATVRVLQGGSVEWTWRGGNQHNVTFNGGPASATQTGGTFQRTFATAGTFAYTCTIHGQSMSGTVTVVAPAQQTLRASASVMPAMPKSALHRHPAQSQAGGRLPSDELKRVRTATARYHDVQNAFADGYVDIDVVIRNMGRHLLRPEVEPVPGQVPVDAQFDPERPELLVYSADASGDLKLVAVEYAVPRNLFNVPPEGFPGVEDVWFDDQGFQLWTLHAWVWKENPDGVFNATNSRVP